MKISSSDKFAIIHETVTRSDCVLSVTHLCGIAGVSRSGYYNWIASEPSREALEKRDRAGFELILGAYRFRGYAKGARSIYMRLLHTNVLMNIKKIRRLMRKYGLKCPIRRANPYRRIAKATLQSHVAPNILERRFRDLGMRMVLLTDITYILYSGGRCYLVTIIDAYSKEVLSYALSISMEADFVLEAVTILVREHGESLYKAETIINSDQGSQYTSIGFRRLVEDNELRQSMSRKANCWDNAPQESFFGHMKDEIDINRCRSFADVETAVDDWIDYYNNDRCQWGLAKLSPKEFAEYEKTGVYPLRGIIGEPHE